MKYLALVALAACGDPLVHAAQTYETRMRLALAREYLRDPTRTPEREGELVRVGAKYRTWLQTQAQTAKARGDLRGALSVQLTVVEADPGEDQQKELTRLRQLVAEAAESELDQRLARGESSVPDYVACRRAAALVEKPELGGRCDSLKAGLKQWLLTRIVTDVPELGGNLRAMIDANFRDGAHELVASAGDDGARATVELSLDLFGRGTVVDEPDVEVRRLPVRGMVRTGKKEKVLVQPDQDEIAEATKKGKKPPEAKVVEKDLYRAATGEYRFFKGAREIRRPYAYLLRRLRDARTVLARDGWIVVREERKYFEYSGEPGLRDDPRGWREGSGEALPSEAALRQGAERRVVDEVVRDVVGALEKDL